MRSVHYYYRTVIFYGGDKFHPGSGARTYGGWRGVGPAHGESVRSILVFRGRNVKYEGPQKQFTRNPVETKFCRV